MIEFIKGTICFIDTQYIIIENRGIGYQIYCGNPFQYEINSTKEITIYTYQHVREDSIKLFGFLTRDERILFERLLNVSGIGPKGALAITAAGRPDQVVKAIEDENEAFLMKFPGVGKKTARQMILDLKGKLADFMPSLDLVNTVDEMVTKTYSDELEDAIEALKSLGYVEKEIKKIAPKLAEEKLTTDQYIKKALQLLLKF